MKAPAASQHVVGIALASPAGQVEAAAEAGRVEPAATREDEVWAALAHVQDPELPLGIVDLGLVYGVTVRAADVHVELTHTAIGCPAIEMMRDDVEEALRTLPWIGAVSVDTVWDPPWTKARLTRRGRAILMACGVGL